MRDYYVIVLTVAVTLSASGANVATWDWACQTEEGKGACLIKTIGIDPINNRFDVEVEVLPVCYRPTSICDRTNIRFRFSDLGIPLSESGKLLSILQIAQANEKRVKFTILRTSGNTQADADKVFIQH
jgi:hypothetical protein